MSDDYCVYARNILSRLDSIANPTTQFTADVARQFESSGSSPAHKDMGLMMMGVLVVVFLMMTLLRKKQQKVESKLAQ